MASFSAFFLDCFFGDLISDDDDLRCFDAAAIEIFFERGVCSTSSWTLPSEPSSLGEEGGVSSGGCWSFDKLDFDFLELLGDLISDERFVELREDFFFGDFGGFGDWRAGVNLA